ncbi:hypothetical protein ACFO9Q_14455 [Paenibacillus sp. GCM10023252]|uniref:hypothetical protein n=1 Tax=Paenibacillus sp. GCM10023252 TaxID=3252649 RepID=UPI00361CDDD5
MKIKKYVKPVICASLTVLMLSGCGLSSHVNQVETEHKQTNQNTIAFVGQNSESVILPKLKLHKKTNESADMIGLIVYKGRIYTQTATHIAPKFASSLLGEKIGRTKGNIDEWSDQSAYATELASTIGEIEIYTVTGYDSDFRIMSYMEQDGEILSEFYECLNGLSVNSGEDIFKKLKLEDNIQSASWEERDSWNYNKQEFHNLSVNETLHKFLGELNKALPIEQQPLQQIGIFETEEQKFVLLKLNDNSEVRLRLFKDSYVMYSNAHVFFKMDDGVFDDLWKSLM